MYSLKIEYSLVFFFFTSNYITYTSTVSSSSTQHSYLSIPVYIVFLLDQRELFCGVPTSVVCHQCISAKQPIVDVENVASWREDMYALLSRAKRLLAPSKAASELYKRVWPNLPILVVP